MPIIMSPYHTPLAEEIQLPEDITKFDEFIISRNQEIYKQVGNRVFDLDEELRHLGRIPGETVQLALDRASFGMTGWNFIVGDETRLLPRITKTEFEDGSRESAPESKMFFVDRSPDEKKVRGWQVRYQQRPEGSRVDSFKPLGRLSAKLLLRVFDDAANQINS